MKSIFYRTAAVLLCFCLTCSLFVPALAVGNQSVILRGIFHFDPHEGGADAGDLPDTFVYSDSYFSVKFRRDECKACQHLHAPVSLSDFGFDKAGLA